LGRLARFPGLVSRQERLRQSGRGALSTWAPGLVIDRGRRHDFIVRVDGTRRGSSTPRSRATPTLDGVQPPRARCRCWRAGCRRFSSWDRASGCRRPLAGLLQHGLEHDVRVLDGGGEVLDGVVFVGGQRLSGELAIGHSPESGGGGSGLPKLFGQPLGCRRLPRVVGELSEQRPTCRHAAGSGSTAPRAGSTVMCSKRVKLSSHSVPPSSFNSTRVWRRPTQPPSADCSSLRCHSRLRSLRGPVSPSRRAERREGTNRRKS